MSWLNPKTPLSLWKLLALAIASGCFCFFSWPAINLHVCLFITLIPLMVVINNQQLSYRKVWLAGHVASIVLMVGGFYWIEYVSRVFGELPRFLSLFVMLAYASYSALHFAIYAVVMAWLIRRYGDWMNLLHPVVFTLADALYPMIFPWYFCAPLAANTLQGQSVDIWGVHGVTTLIVVVNLAGYLLMRQMAAPRPRFMPAVLTIALVGMAGNTAYGLWSRGHWQRQIEAAPESARLSVAIVQPSVSNLDRRLQKKGETGESIEDRYEKLTRQLSNVDLVVWPEVAIHRYFLDSRRTQRRMFKLADDIQSYIYFGALRSENKASGVGSYYFNSSFLIGPGQQYFGYYDKYYLLMFGEFFPLADRFPILKRLIPAIGDFRRGVGPSVLEFDRFRIGPIICYESIVLRYVQQTVQKKPNVLVNITNDGWFGPTNEPEEHFLLTRLRAIEHRQPLIRAVNSGISAIVDQTGKVLGRLEVDAVGTLKRSVTAIDASPTVYSRWGDWWCWLMAIVIGAGIIFGERKRRAKS